MINFSLSEYLKAVSLIARIHADTSASMGTDYQLRREGRDGVRNQVEAIKGLCEKLEQQGK